MTNTELPYWMALAHGTGWKTEKINRLVSAIISEHKGKLEDFFSLSIEDWAQEYKLSADDSEKLLALALELPNYAFLAENLLEQGYQIIPLDSPDYSYTLKKTLVLSILPPFFILRETRSYCSSSQWPSLVPGMRLSRHLILPMPEHMSRLKRTR